ncbi:MAG: hypothetical protein ACR2GY_04965 [Phycisphaerales bacterium]
MHETRNLVLILVLVVFVIWGLIGWFVLGPAAGWPMRWLPVIGAVVVGVLVWYALNVEDKLPDYLAQHVGSMYYDVEGLSFLPTVRVNEDGQAELCLFYQSRFENYCQAIVHMRPPKGAGFHIRPDMHDLHFAFKADGGDFGVLRQPIGVPEAFKGEVLNVKLAAAVRFPRSHGTRLRKHEGGMECGSFAVDWINAFKVGVHDVSSEIVLENPCTIHLALPRDANADIEGSDVWRQELIHPGPPVGTVL